MGLKKDKVLKFERKAEKVIYDFLKEHPDEVFSENELGGVLKKKGVLPPQLSRGESLRTTIMTIAALVAEEKVRGYNYQGSHYYGVKYYGITE